MLMKIIAHILQLPCAILLFYATRSILSNQFNIQGSYSNTLIAFIVTVLVLVMERIGTFMLSEV